MDSLPLLTTDQMASFVARGFLRLDAVVPPDVNAQAMDELPHLFRSWLDEFRGATAHDDGTDGDDGDEVPLPRSGTELADAYAPGSAFGRMVRVPAVAGAIASLVGPRPVVDHHFVHIKSAGDLHAQGLHMDAIVDTGPAFDIQLFWFPHDVAPREGGTRFVPGSHLRRVNMDDVSRYHHLAGEQYFSGEAGTVVIFHQGLWHAGAPNHGGRDRVMGKLRLNPTVPQVRLWDTSDLDARNRADDHVWAQTEPDQVAATLRGSEAWYEPSVHRLETVQRAILWRYLTGDPTFDVDWYLTRTERRDSLAAAATSGAVS
ncbi:MAG: phytanoyl-CoA dioxygenase family protein [Ilumatobacteraceae bacterium]